MSEVPKNPIREKRNRRIAAEAEERKVERAEAILEIGTPLADHDGELQDGPASAAATAGATVCRNC